MRYKFDDLREIYNGKWVVTINSEWKNWRIDTVEVFGVYDTEKEAYADSKHLKSCGVFKMVREEDEENYLGFAFIDSY
ncbi:MAG: hypothetical protein LBE35_05030 [Clostridiales bacterium]|jgi:hypothetical protein|nr:hypothetical protein [Clostridiales bacterium]